MSKSISSPSARSGRAVNASTPLHDLGQRAVGVGPLVLVQLAAQLLVLGHDCGRVLERHRDVVLFLEAVVVRRDHVSGAPGLLGIGERHVQGVAVVVDQLQVARLSQLVPEVLDLPLQTADLLGQEPHQDLRPEFRAQPRFTTEIDGVGSTSYTCGRPTRMRCR
jgi:hypothetical protein